MNDKQNKDVKSFVERFPDTEITEVEDASLVQLHIGKNTTHNTGISLHWITNFKKNFRNISLGIGRKKDLYITMFTR